MTNNLEDCAPNSNTPEAPRRPSSVRQQRRILVVDDEPAARVLANRIFSEAGFQVVAVQSGFECLEQFWKRPHWFDLVLLDLSMPFMDGEETFRRLRAINPLVVVLLSTGFFAEAQGRVERMLAGGLAGFIRKPHRPDELLAQVQAILDRVQISRAGCAASGMASSV